MAGQRGSIFSLNYLRKSSTLEGVFTSSSTRTQSSLKLLPQPFAASSCLEVEDLKVVQSKEKIPNVPSLVPGQIPIAEPIVPLVKKPPDGPDLETCARDNTLWGLVSLVESVVVSVIVDNGSQRGCFAPEPVVVDVKVMFTAIVKDAPDGLGPAMFGLDCCIDGLNNVVNGLDHVAEGLVKYYVGQLDCLLNVPRRPPDPLTIILFMCIYYYKSGARPQTTTRNLSRFPKILLSHETQLQALGDLFFCPPTVGLYLDRSAVALYAWDYLSFNGSGKVSMVVRVWFQLT